MAPRSGCSGAMIQMIGRKMSEWSLYVNGLGASPWPSQLFRSLAAGIRCTPPSGNLNVSVICRRCSGHMMVRQALP